MSAISELKAIQEKNNSMICVGLDLDRKRIPLEYSSSVKGMYYFSIKIVEST